MALIKPQYKAAMSLAVLVFLIGSCLYLVKADAEDAALMGNTDTPIINTNSEVSCSALGMIPDDETKGMFNYSLLLAEVKKGTKINVDGVYYLKSTIDSSDASNLVNNIYLTGESRDASKLILLGGVYFNLNGSAVIENISIECPTSSFSIFIDMVAPFINNITIRNNYVTGYARLVSSRMALDYDYAANPCRVENLTVEDNEFYDIYGYTMLLYDTPVKLASIRNNKVTNFSYAFYYNGITNSNPKQLYLIANSNAIIENNVVVCTDDYDAKARNNGDTERYYLFALVEGFSVECRGNLFEGIHIFDAIDTQIFDNYFSVTKLLYENNTWKNNVNFTAGSEYLDIMKSKVAHSVNGAKTERIYRNNTYIVESGYADQFGEDRYLLRKNINGFVSHMDNIVIEDNYFDMYILNFRANGQAFNESYKFNRNTVLLDTIEHSMYSQAYAYLEEIKDESGSSIPRNLIFTNNTITYDSGPFGQGVGTKSFYLICDYADGDKTTVDFSNNNMTIPDFVFDPSQLEPRANSDTVINFNNNIINGTHAKARLVPPGRQSPGVSLGL